MRAKSIFVGGTASYVGKSWFATAICRFLKRRGARVAPFKAQNMSLNSYPCREGGEIGRAQVVQAEACGLEPTPDMNPILLKPNAELGAQVILRGKVWRNLRAIEYPEHQDFLLRHVLESLERLRAEYEYIVMEGAGSVCELNLKRRDLANLSLARRTGSPALLVADIDRGGVFASLIGTMCLLDPAEALLVRSFAINRFRGDAALFADGVEILQSKTGKPCLGVFPYLRDVEIDAEDSVSLDERRTRPAAGWRVAIVRLPHTSNFTDFHLLPEAQWITKPSPQQFDVVILPGTKNTIGDLEWLKTQGLAEWISSQHSRGARIVGICGGYQMLGERIEDLHHVETSAGAAEGLGLLPVTTVLEREKTTCLVDATTPAGRAFRAYEIHMGRTERPAACEPFGYTPEGPEGIRSGSVIGTYLHGALEDPMALAEILGIPAPERPARELAYDQLADWFERHADIRLFEEQYL